MTLPHSNDPANKPLMTCFLVEDSPIIRQNLIATLEEMLPVHVVGTAEDEPSAKAWMHSTGHVCDLMIIDIFLRIGTGLAVVAEARRLMPASTKLVVLSNYTTSDMRNRCLELGADRVFDKSSELEELLAYCEHLTSQ